jgi:hypothetical protein
LMSWRTAAPPLCAPTPLHGERCDMSQGRRGPAAASVKYPDQNKQPDTGVGGRFAVAAGGGR